MSYKLCEYEIQASSFLFVPWPDENVCINAIGHLRLERPKQYILGIVGNC